MFSPIQAKIAKLAVLGNWEYNAFLNLKRLRIEYEKAGITLLVNERVTLGGLDVVGLDDFLRGSPATSRASTSTSRRARRSGASSVRMSPRSRTSSPPISALSPNGRPSRTDAGRPTPPPHRARAGPGDGPCVPLSARPNSGIVIMSRERSVDIDEPVDFVTAEAMANELMKVRA